MPNTPYLCLTVSADIATEVLGLPCQPCTEGSNKKLQFLGIIPKFTGLFPAQGQKSFPKFHESPLASFQNANKQKNKLECGPMPSLMAALPNIGDALC